MAESNYYELLGVEPTASQAEIKSAFRQAAMRNHPDQGGNPALFRMIEEAYETLVSPSRRAEYDARTLRLTGAPSWGDPDYADDAPTGQWSGGWSDSWRDEPTGAWNASRAWGDEPTGAWSYREPAPEAPPSYQMSSPSRPLADRVPGGAKTLRRIAFWGALAWVAVALLAGMPIIPGFTYGQSFNLLIFLAVVWLLGSLALRLFGYILVIYGIIQAYWMDAPATTVGALLVAGFFTWLCGQWFYTFKNGEWRSSIARATLSNLPGPFRPDWRWLRREEAA